MKLISTKTKMRLSSYSLTIDQQTQTKKVTTYEGSIDKHLASSLQG